MVKKVPADIKTDRLKKAKKQPPIKESLLQGIGLKSEPEKKLKPSTSKGGTTSMDEAKWAKDVAKLAQKPCSVESLGGESVIHNNGSPIYNNGSFSDIPKEHQNVRFLIPRLHEQRTKHAINNKDETTEEYLLMKVLCLEAEIQELKLDNQDLRDKYGDMKEKVHSIHQVLTLFRDELGTAFPKGKVERDFNDIALFY